MTDKNIYMDYAAATPPLDVAKEAFVEALNTFANPSSGHLEGLNAKEFTNKARSDFARVIATKQEEIIFTPSGTSAINLAILGFVNFLLESRVNLRKVHFLFSEIEHTSVLEVAKYIERLGVYVEYLKVNNEGTVTEDEIKNKLKSNTVFVSIPASNSEIGKINDLRTLSTLIKENTIKKSIQVKTKTNHAIIFSDLGQLPVYFSSEPNTLGVDMAVYDAGKLYGIRGVAVLFKKSGVNIRKIIQGGNQEFDLWPGTEPIALYSAFARSIFEVVNKRKEEYLRMTELRKLFVDGISHIDGISVNSLAKKTLPNIVNISTKQNSEYLQAKLSLRGVHVSTKSACIENDNLSKVVYAITKDKQRAKNTLRFSFGYDTTQDDIKYVIEELRSAIES